MRPEGAAAELGEICVMEEAPDGLGEEEAEDYQAYYWVVVEGGLLELEVLVALRWLGRKGQGVVSKRGGGGHTRFRVPPPSR